VDIVEEAIEQIVHSDRGLATEDVSHTHGLLTILCPAERLGANTCARHREQLRADIHEPAEKGLLLLQLRLVAGHRVEHAASQLLGSSFDESQVFRKLTELAVPGPSSPAHVLLRKPRRVECARLGEGSRS